ncbi:hypothetical protein BCV72DRAFT_239673 [Rhizopus microsporus var. microsporus]|uniref:Uncharacterized protein n=2 Tax=Rhizopus microsporus TaxID=58291 RepID=A0A2G4T0C1_RHIZD|nr:uncharacterized protein RHIMIDRAFT_303902 [Rhizopus microsporus ATCC 52813]ORE09421.1 hypothetical protein BCV72DRAFT_239673 [Rhizopus microsporus var. microsporus]PHZ14465.1 hypothetical protein RHIMIDRAFT_303902 [Rhizopus microsporus ATCC 52813]
MSIIILFEALMISLLRLSDNSKEAILQKLRKGYGRRNIRAVIQRHFNEKIRDLFPEAASLSSSLTYVVHRDQFVHSEGVYNTYKKVLKGYNISRCNIREVFGVIVIAPSPVVKDMFPVL